MSTPGAEEKTALADTQTLDCEMFSEDDCGAGAPVANQRPNANEGKQTFRRGGFWSASPIVSDPTQVGV